jgi:hypothetical protein
MSPSLRRVEPPNRKPGLTPDVIYSPWLPLFIVLLTLNLSTAKDVLILYRHKIVLVVDNARAAKPLEEAASRAVFIDSLHADLAKLAVSDPVAAKVIADFFRPAPVSKDVQRDRQPPPSSD